MKTIKLLLLTIVAMCVTAANAQELKKTVLGIEDFTYSSSFSASDAEMLHNQIVNAIQKTGRVIVADHNSATDNALDAESERRKQESAMDANTVADMGTLNANSVLTVNLDQLNVTKEIYEDVEKVKGSDGKVTKVVKGRYPYYKATITYTVKITNCENGAVQGQETYSYSAGSYSRSKNCAEYSNAEEAHKGIMNSCVKQDDISILILNTFKAEGKIIQIDESDAKKAKTVYISLGSEDGVEAKQVLEVYKEVDIAGELSRKLIGEVEVTEVLGASRCLAKVKKGGDVILQVMSAGGNLPVETRDVKARFFGGVK
jgi:hypothetical protein